MKKKIIKKYKKRARLIYTLYGFADGCFYCGKPLGDSYTFCPFTTPPLFGCNRKRCRLNRWVRSQMKIPKLILLDVFRFLVEKTEESL